VSTRVYRYVRGGETRFVPYRPRLTIADDDLEALRLAHPGSTGRPRKGDTRGGLRTIAAILGCSPTAVKKRLRRIAEREEGV
jgi:hypothetical protein